ncbi:MAG: hypothetical protein ABSG33_09745 [Candidatus Bathyarchaeia archaeon]
MVNRFVERWKKKEEQPSIASRVKNVVKPPDNLKQQISLVIQRIDTQTRTLDMALQRFQTRDADIFNRVIKAYTERNEARANIFATELAEIRKIEKMLTHASLAMQSISMRLNTVSEVGDVVTVLAPAKNVLNSIGSEMTNIFPEATQELGNIGNILSDICTSSIQSGNTPVYNGRMDPETEQILREAEQATEKKLKQQLPEVTTSNSTATLTSLEA